MAKRVLCVNMHVVNSMYTGVSNPMKYGILREMERLELEIFFDIDIKFVRRFKFTMISQELLMMADRVMIRANRMKRSFIDFSVLILIIFFLEISFILLYTFIFFN